MWEIFLFYTLAFLIIRFLVVRSSLCRNDTHLSFRGNDEARGVGRNLFVYIKKNPAQKASGQPPTSDFGLPAFVFQPHFYLFPFSFYLLLGFRLRSSDFRLPTFVFQPHFSLLSGFRLHKKIPPIKKIYWGWFWFLVDSFFCLSFSRPSFTFKQKHTP